MDITQMDIKDLKALAYDILINTERLQGDLRNINMAIAKKSQEKIIDKKDIIKKVDKNIKK